MSNKPYLGLRPFRADETDIFFGRETLIDELIDRLSEHHFLAVTGASGCGKSSLVRTGLLDALECGFMAGIGSKWSVIDFHPGNSPLLNLSEELLKLSSKDSLLPDVAFYVEALKRGPESLVSHLKTNCVSKLGNLLIIIDQFEEIFRYPRGAKYDEATALIEILLASSWQREIPIYVVITMRSDFLGDCALFEGLPEAINTSQFLTPRLTREQCQAAIEGPANVFGGIVEPALTNRLLNDMGNDPDQLPLMQHTMMRLWDLCSKNGEITPKLTLEAYLAVGGVKKALSNHADEIINTLSEDERQATEKIFRCLTEGDIDGRDTRRPITINQICEETQIPLETVVRVADTFRRDDSNFLVPSMMTELTVNTVLDISHESLIRQWKYLKKWVSEETKSAELYRRLEQTALLWKKEKAALWGTPDLENILSWKEYERPTEKWANRYGKAYSIAMEFIYSSNNEQQEEIRSIKENQRKTLRRTRIQLSLASFGFCMSLVAALWGYSEKNNADEAEKIAVEAFKAVEQEKEKVQKALSEAENNLDKFHVTIKVYFSFVSKQKIENNFIEWSMENKYEKEADLILQTLMKHSKLLDEKGRKNLHSNFGTMNPREKSKLYNFFAKGLVLFHKSNKEPQAGKHAKKTGKQLERALEEYEKGNYKKTIDIIFKELKGKEIFKKTEEKKLYDAYHFVGNSYEKLNQPKKALKSFESAKKVIYNIWDKDKNYSNLEGVIHITNHILNISSEPNQNKKNINLIDTLGETIKNHFARAKNDVETNTQRVNALYELATFYNSVGKIDKAIKEYEKIINIVSKALQENKISKKIGEENLYDAYHFLGKSYADLDQSEMALKTFQSALKTTYSIWDKDKSYSNLRKIIHIVYHISDMSSKLKQSKKNINLIDTLEETIKNYFLTAKDDVEANTQRVYAFYWLANFYQSVGKVNKAIEENNKAINYASILIETESFMKVAEKDYKETLNTINKAYSLSVKIYKKTDDHDLMRKFQKTKYQFLLQRVGNKSEDGSLYNSLAWMPVQYKLARKWITWDQALDYAQKAVTLQPNHPDYLGTLSTIYCFMGNKKKTLEFNERMIEQKKYSYLLKYYDAHKKCASGELNPYDVPDWDNLE